MKVDEFVELYTKDIAGALGEIEIKNYMSIGQKYLTAKAIVDAVVSRDENGVVKVDSYQLKMVMFYRIYTEYTNLEIAPDDIISAYDKLYLCGALTEIDIRLKNESDKINELAYSYLNDLLAYENSPAKILGEGVSAILSSIGDMSTSFADSVSGTLENVDIGKVAKVLAKLG